MEPIDLEIQRRLEKLKQPLQDAPSHDELEKRLRELKGLPESSKIINKYIILPKPQTQIEQVDNLMQQFSEEVAMSSRASSSVSVDDIERRLRNLKSENTAPSENHDIPRESDTKVLLKKILAEADLERKLEYKFPNLTSQPTEENDQVERMSYSESDSEDEFCSICDKSPKWICKDCDRDMFCSKCYEEYHNEIGESHRRKAYNRRKK